MTETIVQSTKREFNRSKGYVAYAIARLKRIKEILWEDEYSDYRDEIDQCIQLHQQSVTDTARLELKYMTKDITNKEG